jgi:hypothetical protein
MSRFRNSDRRLTCAENWQGLKIPVTEDAA